MLRGGEAGGCLVRRPQYTATSLKGDPKLAAPFRRFPPAVKPVRWLLSAEKWRVAAWLLPQAAARARRAVCNGRMPASAPSPSLRERRLLAAVVVVQLVVPAFALLALAARAGAAGVPPVFFSEVAWMGSDASTSDEWFELTSLAAEAVDLSGWSVTSLKGTGETAAIITFASGTLLLPGQSAVVARFSADASALAAPPFLASSSVSLPNTKLRLRLLAADGTLVDEADDGVGEPMAGSNAAGAKATMERVGASLPGTLAASWRTAEVSQGFDDTAMRGSPGAFVEVAAQSSAVSESSSSSAVTSAAVQEASPAPARLSLSELLPNPVGSDDGEWVELAVEQEGSLQGWVLHGAARAHALAGHASTGVLLVAKEQSGITLANAGGAVWLTFLGEERDRLNYGPLAEGVSYGRLEGEDAAFCMPTPGGENARTLPQLKITLQSGALSGAEKTTFNLALEALGGTLEDAECFVDYGDGEHSDGCNPPSHTVSGAGEYVVTAQAVDVCGNTLSASERVSVFGGASEGPLKAEEPLPSGPAGTAVAAEPHDVALVEALPNPIGNDTTSGETVTLATVAPVPVALRGFSLAIGKKSIALENIVLTPGEANVLAMQSLGALLPNASGSVALWYGGETLAVIAWSDAREGVSYRSAPASLQEYAKALRVIDGDTVEVLRSGGTRESVRLRGIDAPELATFFRDKQDYADEAKYFLRSLIEGKNIELQFDTEMQDAYGRTLAYLHDAAGEDVQALLLHEGLARVIGGVRFSRRAEYEAMQASAAKEGKGLWALGRLTAKQSATRSSSQGTESAVAPIAEPASDLARGGSYVPPSVVMTEVYPSPESGGEEWVELRNLSDAVVPLAGWLLAEQAANGLRTYALPASSRLEPFGRAIVPAGSPLTLNNDGQELFLLHPGGEVHTRVAYPAVPKGASYAQVGDSWCRAVPTPGEENQCDTTVKRSSGKAPMPKAAQPGGLPAYLRTVYVAMTQEEPQSTEERAESGAVVLLTPFDPAEPTPQSESLQRPSFWLFAAGMLAGTGAALLLRKAFLVIVERRGFC